ncbi:hypothetical protein [Aureivirga marina]|uniref:hypothetical protein n=1 Tax=Aureivirga marina TaxID=1182451 RepID=UPI0018CABA66|nr:hypothetical protein [Aureivirga marina]
MSKKKISTCSSSKEGFKYYFTVFFGKFFGNIVFDFLKELFVGDSSEWEIQMN